MSRKELTAYLSSVSDMTAPDQKPLVPEIRVNNQPLTPVPEPHGMYSTLLLCQSYVFSHTEMIYQVPNHKIFMLQYILFDDADTLHMRDSYNMQ